MRVYQFRHVGTVTALCCVFCNRGSIMPHGGTAVKGVQRNNVKMKKAADLFKGAAAFLRNFVVPTEGLEPPHLAAHGPEPCASTNSATWALMLLNNSAIMTTGRVLRQMSFRSLLHINPV